MTTLIKIHNKRLHRRRLTVMRLAKFVGCVPRTIIYGYDMPEYRRPKTTGGTYFFTVVTHCRQPILTSEVMLHGLREGIIRAQKTLPFKIEANEIQIGAWDAPYKTNPPNNRWQIEV